MTATEFTIDEIDAAVAEVERVRKLLKRSQHAQVRSNDEKLAVRATALAWFKSHKPRLGVLAGDELAAVDESYLRLLRSSEAASSRSKYNSELKQLKHELIDLRSSMLSGTSITPRRRRISRGSFPTPRCARYSLIDGRSASTASMHRRRLQLRL